MFKSIIIMMALAIGLAGCAAPQYIPLSQENAKKIQTVNVRSLVVQDEVIAKADPSMVSAGLGGGLIPALIDAAVTNARQARLQAAMDAMYESLEDYDFRTIYWPELTRQLHEQYPFKVTNVVTTARAIPAKDVLQQVQNLRDGEAELFISTDYYLSTDLRSLNIVTASSLWVKGAQQPVYKNFLKYQSAALGSGGEQSAKAWAADGGKPFFDKLKEGIDETLAMLSIDVKENAPASAKTDKMDVKFNFGENASANQKAVKGTLVDKRGERVIIRGASGSLYSLLP
ncbi:hypothetical protein SAMN04515617_10540 [Collimonas sp. OK242]|uniref:hypothetical protein n=1 Tax=Collimonas sp. OK242 TaxID=1798195 RepID=UPI000896D605|nr:hypothetical protein [Collimonas sp. OK242]SDX59270.1 hypothetical protein SAMN04515617_10540 [Collimonas sp. OK242]